MSWQDSLLKTSGKSLENAVVHIGIALYNYPITEYDLAKAGASVHNHLMYLQEEYDIRIMRPIGDIYSDKSAQDLLWNALLHLSNAAVLHNPQNKANALSTTECYLEEFWKRHHG